MFFSTDLLSKRHQSGFGLYWLAATVANSKSTITKLSKKELLTADLQKACNTLAHPPEPLALRLTSGLLLGITRVYGQQWSLFYLDVQHASQSIRKAFSTISEEIDLPAQHGSKSHLVRNKDINLPGDTVRLDAITITRKRGGHVEELMDFESIDPFSISDLNEDLEIELGRGLGDTRIIPFIEDEDEGEYFHEISVLSSNPVRSHSITPRVPRFLGPDPSIQHGVSSQRLH
ncbi:Rec8 like protein-domain-containing protein [Melampsora americana]|nr:Rec8 like protein-domain-containing protein [Melampsora americana]